MSGPDTGSGPGGVVSARGLAPAAMLAALVLAGCGAPGGRVNLCPDTPSGIAVDAYGCPLYSDADAVPDYLDACPDTAPEVAVDADGCPLDADADGVADSRDACPGTPPGARVDASGCPLVGERFAIVTNINFDFDRTNVRDDVKKRLSRVIRLLKEMPGLEVEIVGYTDDVGTIEYNLDLSIRRAQSVREYIIAQGVDPGRLSVSGRGMADPFVPNSTPEGRAVNRRVEFVVKQVR